MFDFSNFNNADIVNTTANNEGMLALFLGTLIFSLILSIILIISYVKALKKSGASLINILWLFLPIPILGSVMLALKIDPKKYGKGSGYLVGMILLPIIFVPIIAFSDNVVKDNSEKQDNTNFDAMNVVNNDVEINSFGNTSIVDNTNNIPVENNNTLEVETDVNRQGISNLNIEPQIENSINVVDSTIKDMQEQNNGTLNNEPVLDSTPIMESAPAFNSVPEIPVSEPVGLASTIEQIPEKPVEPNINNGIDNVVQIEPIMEEPIKVEEVYVTPIVTDNKVCKNCGNAIPDIVSICPNCGTDNE